ncbi:LysR family transcriptional regulator [Limosilactobacillus pontis]|uniref:Transcriptional regulator, LysR family n=1 Tax=Limosilactobacillus pontis DSM 8475 TaxID=1423794 RepID=A0A922PW69_9LACO|nr:LysR family transcriptional regulator [Limosilactobacillus pontis]KRM38018.1 transcriptional regulator, LysR family [Limosilactobacillus pontis DSM 8475]QFV01678.1 LysR family transcriptional regulator [Limosilactobacillus pontis]
MDVRVLRYFIEIVREGNISSAAHRLHISQPALSRQIMDLETTLGVTLFERGHRQIKLTQEGYYLYERAQEITALVDKTTYHLQANEVVSGTLDIGAGESRALSPLMDVVAQILRDYPEVKVNLVSGDATMIRRQVDQGSLEFGVVMGHENLLNYDSLTLPAVNRWGILLCADAPLAAKEAIEPQDLLGHPLLASAQSRLQDTFRDWAGDLINQYNFVGNYNLIYNAELLVKTGACLALAYDGIANLYDQDLVFRPLTPAVTDTNILIWNKDRHLPNVGQLFLQLLRERISTDK